MSSSDISARWFQDQSVQIALRCSSDGALITIPYTVEQTHDGRFFFTNFYVAALASGANLDMLVVTGATTVPHIAVMCDIGAAATLSVYEGVTTSSDGTPLTAFNANRQSTKITTASVTQTPTVTGTGTALLLNHYIPGGTTGNSIGGSSSDFARVTELLLKTSTKYLFRMTNLGAGATGASMQLGWFEDV